MEFSLRFRIGLTSVLAVLTKEKKDRAETNSGLGLPIGTRNASTTLFTIGFYAKPKYIFLRGFNVQSTEN